MDEEIAELFMEFTKGMVREGARRTVGAAFKFLNGSLNSSSKASTRLTHVGTNFFMNSNTVLYYSYEDGVVYGYSLQDFGDRWVRTNIHTSESPSGFDGGYSNYQKLFRDQYGNLYKE